MNEFVEQLVAIDRSEPTNDAEFISMGILQDQADHPETKEINPFNYFGRGWLHSPVQEDEPQLFCLRLAGADTRKRFRNAYFR